MNVLDIFSGIGGFSLGLERAGMRTRAFCEVDPFCREWLAQQWPGIPCYADVRELLVHFRTRANQEDIEVALRSTLSKFEHQTGIAAELAISGHGLPLAADVQIQVLHMVQEALSNVRKHSQAHRVQLRVQRHPWSFEVQDDGVGFDTSAQRSPDSLHVGLGIMRERAQGIGATVQVQSAPGQGTTVRIALPHQPLPSTEDAAEPGDALPPSRP